MLPFYVSKLFRSTIEGTALPQAAGLKLVFHTPEEGQHIFDAEVQEVVVPWAVVPQINVDRGLISTTVELTLVSSELFPRPLQPADNKLVLEIRRRDHDELERFERAVAKFRAGAPQDDTEEFIDDMRDFLDRM